MYKKKVAVIAIIIFGLALFLLANNVFSDDITSTPSGEGLSNTHAWYDEYWQATKFYRLKLDTGTTAAPPLTYKYEAVTDPTTTSSTTFTGSDGTGTSASIPQDIVVTEWQVTGHVHFQSGL